MGRKVEAKNWPPKGRAGYLLEGWLGSHGSDMDAATDMEVGASDIRVES